MTDQEDEKKAKTIGDFVTLIALTIIKRPFVMTGLIAALASFFSWNAGSGISNLTHSGKLSLRFDTLELNTKAWHKQDSAAWSQCLIAIKGLKINQAVLKNNAKKTVKKEAVNDTLNTGAIAKTQE